MSEYELSSLSKSNIPRSPSYFTENKVKKKFLKCMMASGQSLDAQKQQQQQQQ